MRRFNRLTPYLFALPAVVVVIALMIYPTVYTGYMSLHSTQESLTKLSFVGLKHFITIFTADPRAWDALGRSLVYTVLALIFELVLGIILALLLNRDFRGVAVVRALCLLPMVATPAAMSLIWMIMFNPTMGVLNYLLGTIGLAPLGWVSDLRQALASLVLIDIWHGTPFVMLIVLAGLRAVPKEPYEAAMIDGASSIQTFRYLTLPLIRPAIMVAMMFRFIDAMKIFDQIWIITEGGPGYATETLYVYTYKQAFKYLDFGYGSALILAFLGVIIVLSLVFMRARRRKWL